MSGRLARFNLFQPVDFHPKSLCNDQGLQLLWFRHQGAAAVSGNARMDAWEKRHQQFDTGLSWQNFKDKHGMVLVYCTWQVFFDSDLSATEWYCFGSRPLLASFLRDLRRTKPVCPGWLGSKERTLSKVRHQISQIPWGEPMKSRELPGCWGLDFYYFDIFWSFLINVRLPFDAPVSRYVIDPMRSPFWKHIIQLACSLASWFSLRRNSTRRNRRNVSGGREVHQWFMQALPKGILKVSI